MDKKHISLFIIFIGVALGTAFLFYSKSASGPNLGGATGRLAQILNRGEMIVGVDATYAPLEYKDNNGNFVGMDIDLAKAVADNLGVKISFKDIAWNNLFDAIKNGDVDLSISSITITAERAETLGFSDPYFNAGQVIVVSKSNTKKIHTPQDLRGLKVGAQINTTSDTEAQKYASSPSDIFHFEQYSTAEDELLNGKIDAIIIDYPAAVSMTSKEPRLTIASDIFTQEFYGMATQKGEESLLLRLNSIIRKLKQDGVLKALETKWLAK